MPTMPAEYYRRYRATVKARNQRKAYQEGIAEGVDRCCKLMQTLYGERALTGFAAAHAISKTLGITSVKT